MCCFSQPVQNVGNTRIFARRFDRDRQYLAYQMQFQTARPNAMILPLPVAPSARAAAVRFISLKEYSGFFEDLDQVFSTESRLTSIIGVGAAEGDSLTVVDVGDFVASFVPTLRDFSRLDARFAIKPAVWKRLPRYADYGFAVFQLKAPLRTLTDVHPMALEFRTRLKDKIFFPTVHIHDGTVRPREEYDHQLYWQGKDENAWTNDIRTIKYNPKYGHWSRPEVKKRDYGIWITPPPPRKSNSVRDESEPPTLINGIESRLSQDARVASSRYPPLVDARRAKGIFSTTLAIHRWTIREVRKNEDILV